MNHFYSIDDIEDPEGFVQKAIQLKQSSKNFREVGKTKSLCMIFLNPSLRTRLSTLQAANALGMDSVVFNVGEDGWQLEFEDGVVMNGTKAEHIKEAAAVIGSYFDVLAIRSFAGLNNREEDYADKVLKQFIKYAQKPIINLESAIRHPLQSLTDLITIRENTSKPRPRVVLSWAPHPRALPQAVANSFVEWMMKAEVDLVVTHPEGYELAPEFSRGVAVEYNQAKAFDGADFIYAKNWSSFTSYGQILSQDPSWMIDQQKMD